jgi:hypothetical protein
MFASAPGWRSRQAVLPWAAPTPEFGKANRGRLGGDGAQLGMQSTKADRAGSRAPTAR